MAARGHGALAARGRRQSRGIVGRPPPGPARGRWHLSLPNLRPAACAWPGETTPRASCPARGATPTPPGRSARPGSPRG
eukprot:14571858-Alexandrium_andersonii.AAC.1